MNCFSKHSDISHLNRIPWLFMICSFFCNFRFLLVYKRNSSTLFQRKNTRCIFDPLGRPTVPAGSDNCFCTCFRPYVRHHVSKQNKTSPENNDHYWWGTVGLAEGIIDDTCLVFLNLISVRWWAPIILASTVITQKNLSKTLPPKLKY